MTNDEREFTDILLLVAYRPWLHLQSYVAHYYRKRETKVLEFTKTNHFSTAFCMGLVSFFSSYLPSSATIMVHKRNDKRVF